MTTTTFKPGDHVRVQSPNWGGPGVAVHVIDAIEYGVAHLRSTVRACPERSSIVDISSLVLEDCPTCDGSGEVHTNPDPRRDPQCVIGHECPTCHGTGAWSESC